MTKVLVLGANGYIGTYLVDSLQVRGFEVVPLTKDEFDITGETDFNFMDFDAVFICAGKSKFIECEEDRTSYRVNVDAPLAIARRSKCLIYLSSDVVERALHTAYGLQKAVAEVGLLAMGNVIVARICKRVSRANIAHVCKALGDLVGKPGGLYRL